MMDSTFVQEIADLGAVAQGIAAKIEIVDGETFSTVPLHLVRVPAAPEPKALVVHTLSGLRDYVAANRDELELANLVVHVEGPERVSLLSRLEGEHHQRFAYLTASSINRFAAVPAFQFGRFLAIADVTIALMALFGDSQQRATLLQILGTVKVEEGVQQEDDGVTQRVTAKRGIRLVSEVPVPSPIVLRPFRTFPELDQPESPFVVRLHERGAGVEVALFEADGGAWKLAAITGAAAWLRENLPPELAVIA